MFEGVGEFIGGVAYVLLSLRIKSKLFIITTNKLLTISMLFLIIIFYLKNVVLLSFSVVALGFVDCCFYSLNLSLVSESGWNKKGFSVFNIIQCAGNSISILLIMFVKTQPFIMYILGVQIVSSVLLHSFQGKKNKF